MRYRLRAAMLLAGLMLVLTACASQQAQANTPKSTSPGSAAPTLAPTMLPPTVAPTALPTLPAKLTIAGVDVGGLSVADARQKLERALASLQQPIELRAGDQKATLAPADIGLELPLDALLSTAEQARAGQSISLTLTYDQSKLQAALDKLGAQLTDPPAVSVITSTKIISRSFAVSGGYTIDTEAALAAVDTALHDTSRNRSVNLPLTVSSAARPTPEQLQDQIELIAKQWKEVAGVMVYDLATGKEIASLNKGTVFSAASTIKVAIMLNAYIQLDTIPAKLDAVMKKMIIDSDNIAANAVLAASAGGSGTEAALKGAEQMSATLKSLGLGNTYLYVPFEATDYLAQKKLKYQLGPVRAGTAPYTDSGRALRTSPGDMATIYLYIDQCSRGEGVLIKQFPKLNAKRCSEMLDRLFANADRSRMRSGLDRSVRVEHKSGWIDDMQADAGIVRSPGGDFAIAVYLFRTAKPSIPLPDSLFAPYLGAFTRLVYSYYNPVVVAAP
ncbi:MAG: serine hydrolase [Kouleothrix sp.]|jgi:beta-lactamase class A